MKPSSLKKIIQTFSSLPGLGQKSSERIAFTFLQKKPEELEELAQAILELKDIKKCKICNYITTDEECSICSSKDRDRSTICVVDDIKNIWLFEENNIFNGRYFMLSGLINPIQGVDIESLNLNQLEEMIKINGAKELLLALKPSIEGETTSLYLSKIYKNQLKVTRLAQGVPLGADIEFLDPLTLEHAMKDRKEV